MDYPKGKQLQELSDANGTIIAFEGIIPKNETEQWFVNRGNTLESRVKYRPLSTRLPPGTILIEKALFDNYVDSTNVCILGPAQKKVQAKNSWIGHLFRKQEQMSLLSLESVVFHSSFIPYRNHSWAAMEQFLTFLFTPLSYIKKVEMFAVNQKFVDAVKEKFVNNFPIQGNQVRTQKNSKNKPLYIHCEIFALVYKPDMSFHDLRDILKWLLRNVRADSIRMLTLRVYTHYQDRAAVCRLLTNFVFGAMRICAKRELRLHSLTETNLIVSLVEKFRTLPHFKREIPTIVIESFSTYDFEYIQPNLGPNVIQQEVDSQGAEFLYLFENGHNRMRISFCEKSDDRWAKYDCFVKFNAIQLLL
ncbi:hypothetical protein DdX_13524 [Ditylenchus destructor]|uniref:Uncharacterized protein n=1 Tax=Ditylenchus destructor TaxID=166010 RepID=A0AAD4MTF1_9BILA|nr:hypothetical protein DdX_13524 [Ditylenchus destructor]